MGSNFKPLFQEYTIIAKNFVRDSEEDDAYGKMT
jgi:hypothetical protein